MLCDGSWARWQHERVRYCGLCLRAADDRWLVLHLLLSNDLGALQMLIPYCKRGWTLMVDFSPGRHFVKRCRFSCPTYHRPKAANKIRRLSGRTQWKLEDATVMHALLLPRMGSNVDGFVRLLVSSYCTNPCVTEAVSCSYSPHHGRHCMTTDSIYCIFTS